MRESLLVAVHPCVTDDFPGTSRAGLRPPRTSSSTWVQSSAPLRARSPLKAPEKSGFGTPERLPLLALVLLGCGGSQTTPIQASQSAPEFSVQDQSGQVRTLREFRGKAVVLYFYPRDATPGCTAEACAFRDSWQRYEEAGAQVLGVSTDDVESHREFAEEHSLPFPLLADTDERVAKAYGVPVRVGFAKRITFLIDGSGVVRRVFENVDPGVHADEVLTAIGELP